MVEYPQNLTLKSGDTAAFTCKPSDLHHRRIDWYFLNETSPQDIYAEELVRYKEMINHNNVSLCQYFKYLYKIKYQ